jgi:hypothetical protein
MAIQKSKRKITAEDRKIILSNFKINVLSIVFISVLMIASFLYFTTKIPLNLIIIFALFPILVITILMGLPLLYRNKHIYTGTISKKFEENTLQNGTLYYVCLDDTLFYFDREKKLYDTLKIGQKIEFHCLSRKKIFYHIVLS